MDDENLETARTELREALRDADTLNDAEGVSDPEWSPDDVTGKEWRKMGARLEQLCRQLGAELESIPSGVTDDDIANAERIFDAIMYGYRRVYIDRKERRALRRGNADARARMIEWCCRHVAARELIILTMGHVRKNFAILGIDTDRLIAEGVPPEDWLEHLIGDGPEQWLAEQDEQQDDRAERQDMKDAHADGLHAEAPRDGCPLCDDRKGRL